MEWMPGESAESFEERTGGWSNVQTQLYLLALLDVGVLDENGRHLSPMTPSGYWTEVGMHLWLDDFEDETGGHEIHLN